MNTSTRIFGKLVFTIAAVSILGGCTTFNNQGINKQQLKLNVDDELLTPSKPLITLEQYKKQDE